MIKKTLQVLALSTISAIGSLCVCAYKGDNSPYESNAIVREYESLRDKHLNAVIAGKKDLTNWKESINQFEGNQIVQQHLTYEGKWSNIALYSYAFLGCGVPLLWGFYNSSLKQKLRRKNDPPK